MRMILLYLLDSVLSSVRILPRYRPGIVRPVEALFLWTLAQGKYAEAERMEARAKAIRAKSE